jgi:aspartyl-tRNA(Asn)/glutamyl-tRNA(Gln) amidotransferase subunit C
MLVWPDVSHCAKNRSAKEKYSAPGKPRPCYREQPQACKIDGFSGLECPLLRLDPAALTSAFADGRRTRFASRWRIPMALERSEVEKIAHLARLGLNENDLPRTTETLNNILGLIDRMQAVDTTGIEPLAHPLETHQRLRADEVTERNQRDAYQAIAPAVESGLYLVPRVIE